MITITIEGPAGSGKTKISNALQRYLCLIGQVTVCKEEVTDAFLIKNAKDIDVIIIEKTT